MRIWDAGLGFSVTYPNSVHFAFTPAIISISGRIKSASVEITSDSTGQSYTENRKASPAGGVVFDIQRYLQMILEGIRHSVVDYSVRFSDSPIVRKIHVKVTVSVTTFEFDMDCVWGALDAGERCGGPYIRTWFVNYPFTFNVISKPSNFFDVKCDDGPVSSLAFGLTTTDEDDYHHYIVNPARVFDTFLANRRLYIAIPNALQIRNDVERVGVTSYDLRISRDCSGVYLRWIDRQGQYEYYLFQRTAHEYAISKDESFSRNEMSNPAQYVDGVNIGTSTRQILRQAETLTIVAPLIDDPTYDYLSDLAQSPVVDLFTGYDDEGVPMWRRVNVATGSRTRSNDLLQDFNVSITLPEKNAQIL